MIGEGVMILAIGMGMVFLFFIVLNGVMKLIEIAIGILSRRFPEKVLVHANQAPVPATDEGAQIAVAIAVARQRMASAG